MSTTAPISERTITAVLLALWRAGASAHPGGARGRGAGGGGGEVSIQQVLKETLAPLPDVQMALEILGQRRCLIERTPAGVRLVSAGLSSWADILPDEAARHGLRLGRRAIALPRTASTNDVAWAHAAEEDADGLVVLADEQTAGRGRMGHAWFAPPRQSLLMSVMLRGVPRESLDRLTLLAGLATAVAMEEISNMPRLEIKWPNDLLAGGRKLAGILVEHRLVARKKKGEEDGAAVIGIGVNVSQVTADFPGELRGCAASLYQAAGVLVDRLRLAAAILRSLDGRLALGKNDDWLALWKERCQLLGKVVHARTGAKELSGQVIDVDPLQGLLIRDGAGATHFLSAQTTTLSG